MGAERAKGVVPRQTSSPWNIEPTGRCFKTNLQRTRALSGANFSNGVRKRDPTEDHDRSIVIPPITGKGPGRGRVDRAGFSIYVCAKQTPTRGGDAERGAGGRGGGAEGTGPEERTCPVSLAYAVTAKAVRN